MANERVDRAPVEEFAAQLRRLRESAGEPSFRQMARAAHFSSSTLAEAVQGRRLPSQAVVEAFATVCGADPREWAVKLQAAAAATAEPFADSLPAPVPAEPAGAAILSPGRRGWRYAVQAAVLVIAFALGFLARGLLAPSQPVHTAAPTPSGGALVTASRAAGIPHDGADPSDEGCSRDSTIADHATMLDGTVSVGVLELRRSAVCRGGWARFYLMPGQPPALVEVRLEAEDGRVVSYAQTVTAGLPLYTDLLRPDNGCLRALAIAHLHGQLITSMTECLLSKN
jgi:transcriptional regulator with XRE-family HTH domain